MLRTRLPLRRTFCARVKPGQYAPRLDHYYLLRTLQDMYGLKPTGFATKRVPLRGLWTVR